MPARGERREIRLDVVALVVAGAVDLLAGVDAGALLADGTLTSGSEELANRASWIADNTARWQAGWTFWFVVTTTFAWSFYALARNLDGPRNLRHLVVGMALLAAAVDLVGIVLNLAVLPDLAERLTRSMPADGSVAATYSSVETLAQALTDIAAFGLYTTAGLLILPALFMTRTYPRALAWLGLVLWVLSAVATALLATDGPGAISAFSMALLLYVPWVWGGAWWLVRTAEDVS